MNYSVNLSSGQTIEVVIGEAAQINIEQALNYIESGRVEITSYVNEWAKPEIANYTNEYAEPIVTEIVNQTTKPLIDNYLDTTTKPQIDEYVADNVKPYADSAQDSAAKAKISEDNAKTSETNAKASELAAASSAGVASAAAETATEAKDYTAKVLTDKNLNAVGQDLQSADSNIKTVATNIVNVNTVAKNIDNVNLLAPHTEAMEALAPDIMDVVTVAGIAEQTKNVSNNMTAVVDVSNNKSNINNVSVNMPFVEGVSENITNVVAVDRNKTNIDNVATNKININNVAENITSVNNVSENMADVKNAVQSANDAKLWAVGTIAEKPEGSSKYWAEQAKQTAQIYDATETVKGIVRLATSEEVTAGTNNSAVITPLKLKPNLDTKQDKSTAVNYNNITNCFTEIPQDIKLELNNGTLTLKAGSKVYVPNGFETSVEPLYAWITPAPEEIYYTEKETPAVGDKTYNENGVYTYYKVHDVSGTTLTLQKGKDTDSVIMQSTVTRDTSKDTYFSKPDTTKPKFDVVTIDSDVSDSADSNRETMLFYRVGQKVLEAMPVDYCFSGTTAPTSFLGGNFAVWYDTTNNVIKLTGDSGSTWNTNYCFPICLAQETTTTYSISQVFNGFGYVGSTVYALPGVKGLIPNGRNADGSLKNIEFTLDKVHTFNLSVSNMYEPQMLLFDSALNIQGPTSIRTISYNEVDNYTTYNGTNQSWISIITFVYNDNKITSFTPKTVFHALEYNDKSTISGWSMPSSRYIDLTLGASGTTYTAPANGWFNFDKRASNAGQYVVISNETDGYVWEGAFTSYGKSVECFKSVPVKKGDTIKIVYTLGGETIRFAFIYAEGDKSSNVVSSSDFINGSINGSEEDGDMPDFGD